MSLISWKNKSTSPDQERWERVQQERAEPNRQYEELMQQQLISQSAQSQSASSSTWPPPELRRQATSTGPVPQRAIDEVAENAVAKAHASARETQIKLQDLQRAVASIVLRLKVLDVEALEKDLGEDGTVPLRLALSELKQLVAAYDGMTKSNMPDYIMSYTTTAMLEGWCQQQWLATSGTCSGSSSSSSSTGGKP